MVRPVNILKDQRKYTVNLDMKIWTEIRMDSYTSVMTPMRSISWAGLRGVSLGVECPLGGEEEVREDAVAEAVMEAPG